MSERWSFSGLLFVVCDAMFQLGLTVLGGSSKTVAHVDLAGTKLFQRASQ